LDAVAKIDTADQSSKNAHSIVDQISKALHSGVDQAEKVTGQSLEFSGTTAQAVSAKVEQFVPQIAKGTIAYTNISEKYLADFSGTS
jgi:hypothetical protein